MRRIAGTSLAVSGSPEGNLGKGGRSQGVIRHSPTSPAEFYMGGPVESAVKGLTVNANCARPKSGGRDTIGSLRAARKYASSPVL